MQSMQVSEGALQINERNASERGSPGGKECSNFQESVTKLRGFEHANISRIDMERP